MIGLLFSGQGSQKSGMGLDLYKEYPIVKDFYDSLDLDFDLKEISFNSDADTLKKTIYTQPSLVAFHLAVLRILKAKAIEFNAVAGLSLGEYSALVASQAISENQAMEIIENRSKYMSKCCKDHPSTMIALLSKNEDLINEKIDEIKDKDIFIEVGNLNCPGQVVLGIKEEDQDFIEAEFSDLKGVRVVPLEVEGAFHTSLMGEAEEKLARDFEKFEFNEPHIPIYMNRTGKKYDGEDLGKLMAEQASHTTNFQSILENMIADGVDVFLEIGFNDIFKGFVKRIDKNIKVVPVNSVETIEELQEAING